jgi:hypothetical protein
MFHEIASLRWQRRCFTRLLRCARNDDDSRDCFAALATTMIHEIASLRSQ